MVALIIGNAVWIRGRTAGCGQVCANVLGSIPNACIKPAYSHILEVYYNRD
jgi:hypothetical protein